jgi:pyruvate dehydrogenase E2 component (dihydrolipoamide acetyltransferase)
MPIEITMPRLSDTMESGTIIKWGVSEGDTVSAGDVVADIETDKATMEMPVFDDGVLAKILVEEGRTVDVGTVIAVLAEDDEDVSEAAAHAPGAGTANGHAATQDDEPEVIDKRPTDQAQDTQTTDDGPQRISPVARRLIEEHNLDPRTIQGSGPHGRIIKRDVLNAVESKDETAASVPPSTRQAPSTREVAEESRSTAMVAANVSVGGGARPQSSGQTTEIELSNMRQTIAKRLVESKTSIPHYQLQATFNMDPLMEFRAQLNEQLEPQGVKLSVNDFLIRACALAIRRHPEFNSSWGGDRLFVHSDINVGVAIALPAERGGGSSSPPCATPIC